MSVDWTRLLCSVLLFVLVYGMSATVDFDSIKHQIKNVKAIGTGLLLQFLLLPFVGFLTVYFLDLDHATGIILLVVTSSPGGSYSNWFCSVFNADLALSITMTAISTCLSLVILPLNLLLYVNRAYGDDEEYLEMDEKMDWGSLAISIFVVIAATGLGLYASYRKHSHDFNRRANVIGNYAGLVLVLVSFILASSHKDARLWNRESSFYGGVAIPCIVAVIVANVVTIALKLPNPEIVTISIESCFQNVGIGMTVAISMFEGEDLARSVAVPFYYGLIQATIALVYSLVTWKLGWTKAPANIGFWKMIATSYEILVIEGMEGHEPHKEADGFFYVESETKPSATRKTTNEEPNEKDDNGFCFVEAPDNKGTTTTAAQTV